MQQVEIKPTDEAYGFAPQLVPEQFLRDMAGISVSARGLMPPLTWKDVGEAIRCVNEDADWKSRGALHDIITIVNALDYWERRQALGSILD